MTESRPDRIEAFLRTLEQLPPFAGITYRGCAADSHQAWGSRLVVSSGVVSTTRDPRVATENFTTPALYAVVSTTGRAIEAFSAAREQREVVFLPASQFFQVERVRVGDLPITIVEQLEPGQEAGSHVAGSLEQIESAVATAVLAARERPELLEAVRGKFSGDIT